MQTEKRVFEVRAYAATRKAKGAQHVTPMSYLSIGPGSDSRTGPSDGRDLGRVYKFSISPTLGSSERLSLLREFSGCVVLLVGRE